MAKKKRKSRKKPSLPAPIEELGIEHLEDPSLYVDDEGNRPQEKDVIKSFSLARERQKTLSPSRVKRDKVMQDYQDTFELIGGVPRMAAWAHENPGAFYRMHSKLLPSATQNKTEHSGEIKITAAIPPSPLDSLPKGMEPRVIDGEVIDE